MRRPLDPRICNIAIYAGALDPVPRLLLPAQPEYVAEDRGDQSQLDRIDGRLLEHARA